MYDRFIVSLFDNNVMLIINNDNLERIQVINSRASRDGVEDAALFGEWLQLESLSSFSNPRICGREMREILWPKLWLDNS